MADGGSDALPDWVTDLKPHADAITDFFRDPVGAIIGGVAVFVTTTAFKATQLVIDGVLLVFGGSEPLASPPDEGLIGLADLPMLVMRTVVLQPASLAGDQIMALLRAHQAVVMELTARTGPAAPLVTFAIFALEGIVLVYVGRGLLTAFSRLPVIGSAIGFVSGGRL